MNKLILTTALVFSTCTSAAFAEGPILTITDFIGTISVTEGAKIKVSGDVQDIVRQSGEDVTINGGEDIQNSNCKGHYGKYSISLGKKSWLGRSGGYKDLEDYPSLNITAPDDVHLVVRNSVIFGEASDIGSADLELSSCGDLTIGNIDGPVDLDIRGSADFTGGNTGPAIISVRGSGDVELGDVKSAEIDLSGSGDIELGGVKGPLILDTRGSGDFEAGTVKGDLVYEGRGSSDFQVDSVFGKIAIDVSGSSDVSINDGDIADIFISASGSSDVDFGGSAVTADLIASGSSDININDVSGKTNISRSGSADIRVGDKTYSN